MKDVTKIVDRLKKDCEKANIKGWEEIFTVEEGLNILAEEWTLSGTTASKQLFIKYGVYAPQHVKEHISYLYKLIEDKVEQKQLKARTRVGLTEEEAQEEIERNKILDSIEGKRIIGYARVSTKDQNLARQLKTLKEQNCDVIFKDKLTGKNTDRIQYKAMMEAVRKGDVIIISELTRIARSTSDLFKIMEQLEEKGVMLKSIKEEWLDTTTATGRLLFTIMAGISQFERELMLERQSEGIKVAKENGVKFGVKLSEDADIELAINMVKEGKYTMTQIAKMCHISRTTLWRRCKALGLI